MFHCRLLLSVVAATILIGGCHNTASVDNAIDDIVIGGMRVRDQVIKQSDGVVADYQVYRDGKAEGVVYKYIYAADVEFDRTVLSSATVKKDMADKIRGDANLRGILATGVYLKFLHITSSGEVIAEAKLTSQDL